MLRRASDSAYAAPASDAGWSAWPANDAPPRLQPAAVLVLVVCSLIPSLFLWWACRSDVSVLGRYWDGPNYLEVAKTLYHVPTDHPFAAYGTTPAYFACHLPLYPLLIRALAPLLGYPAAMLAATWASSAAATVAFYRVLQVYGCVRSPLYSAALSTFLPARWAIYKTVGATEPLFMLLACLALLAYRRERIATALLFAALSGITRITGVLFLPFFLVEFVRTRRYARLPLAFLVLVPIAATFWFYRLHFGDFWAYFSWNAGLIHPLPTALFREMAASGDTHGSELYLLMYSMYGVGVLLLFRFPPLFLYAGLFYGYALFVYHEDVSRYLLASAPFALIVAYDRILDTRAFRIALPFVAYLVLAYAAGVLPTNVVDAKAWASLLAQPEYRPF
jgi:hypothetical protein